MTNCKNCDESIPQTEGKRKRDFCNSTCRSNFWQKAKRSAGSTEAGQPAAKKKKPANPPSKKTGAKKGLKSVSKKVIVIGDTHVKDPHLKKGIDLEGAKVVAIGGDSIQESGGGYGDLGEMAGLLASLPKNILPTKEYTPPHHFHDEQIKPNTFADFKELAASGITLDDLNISMQDSKLSPGEKDLVRRKRIEPKN